MSPPFGWGILAPGNIARRFASDLRQLEDAQLVAVGSRSAERAQSFAQEFGASRAYGSYADLIADPKVEAIYVAPPHPFHKEHAIACLRAGKAVLCEKPMAVNACDVAEMIQVARQEKVFLMEAMWTRFLPVTCQVREWLQGERIGQVRMLSADLGFRARCDPSARLFNRELAGGALLDVGVYTVALAHMIFGRCPETIQALAHLGETGVDEQTVMSLRYAGGELARLACAVRTTTPQEAWLYGTEGMIHIPAFWHAPKATLYRDGEEPVETVGEVGYHFEAAEVMVCVRSGRNESSIMPLDESLDIARTMDAVRRQIGLRYPWE